MLPAAAFARLPALDLLDRAVLNLGGAAPLARVTAIGWLGAAEVVTPERTLRLGIRTRIEPFVRASSTSWVVSDGVSKARTLVIERDAGFIERNGRRTALPRD